MRVYMCAQYGDGKKRRKPNYSSVDLSEVEWEDKDDTVGHNSSVTTVTASRASPAFTLGVFLLIAS